MKRVLTHIPLQSPIHYSKAAIVQDALVRHQLNVKAGKSLGPLLGPILLTMEMQPVYTTGRRERGSMDPQRKAILEDGGRVAVIEALRGGQTTFHGPGQLVAYPIIDLPTASRPSKPGVKGVSARCYVHMLEESIITALRRYDIDAFRTSNTGVWVDQRHKIAAIGVHLRRGITSHGIALNVNVDLRYFDRIVACGLPDMKATSIHSFTDQRPSLDHVRNSFVASLAKELDCERIETVALPDFQVYVKDDA